MWGISSSVSPNYAHKIVDSRVHEKFESQNIQKKRKLLTTQKLMMEFFLQYLKINERKQI
jgi:hypothetical protein